MSISYFLVKVPPNVNSVDDINDNNLLAIDSKNKIIDIMSEISNQLIYVLKNYLTVLILINKK